MAGETERQAKDCFLLRDEFRSQPSRVQQKDLRHHWKQLQSSSGCLQSSHHVCCSGCGVFILRGRGDYESVN